MANPALKRVQARVQGTTAAPSARSTGPTSWAEGFGRSFIESFPEMIGIDPSLATERWRAENPIGGVVSELVGMAIPYGGWAAATSKIPAAARVLGRIGTAEKLIEKPIRTRALVEAARWAPFEAARTGVAAVAGDPGNWKEVGTEGLVNVGIGAGIGAGIGVAKSIKGALQGRQDALKEIQRVLPEFNTAAPRPLQIRQISELIGKREAELGAASGDDSILPYLRSVRGELERQTRAEYGIPVTGRSGASAIYVRDLERSGANRQQVNKMFHLHSAGRTEASGFITRRFLDTGTGLDFKNHDQIMQVIRRFGLGDDFWGKVQFPRYTTFLTDQAAKNYAEGVKRNFFAIGDGWFMTKESALEDGKGLYVMAKRLGKRSKTGAPDPKASDEWLIFKTDLPADFKKRKGLVNLVTSQGDWETGYLSAKDLKWAKDNLELYGAVENFMEIMPFNVSLGMTRGKHSVAELERRAAQMLGIEEGQQAVGEAGRRVKALAKEFLAPALYQFSSDPLARWLHGVVRYAFDKANAIGYNMMYGELAVNPKGSIFREALGRPREIGNIKGKLDALNEEDDLTQLWLAWHNQYSPEEARKRLPLLSTRVFDLLKELEKWDNHQLRQLMDTQRFVGQQEFIPTPNHYMIAKTWQGDWRQSVVDEAGNVVYIASGNRAQAAARAKAIIEEAKKAGKNWRVREPEPQLSNRRNDLDMLKELKIHTPGYDFARLAALRVIPKPKRIAGGKTEIPGGYVGYEKPWSKKELEDIIREHVFQRQRHIAELTVFHRLRPHLGRLGASNIGLQKQLLDRVRDLTGRPGPMAKFQNAMMDRLTFGLLGKNSATKIVSVANTYQMNMQLGMGNMAFPILNALTFMTTVLPRAAFVMASDLATLQRNYTMFAAGGPDGLPRAAMGMFDPLKFFYRSVKGMRKPESISPDGAYRRDITRASGEGVTDPRLVEEYLGQQAGAAFRFKDLLSGDQGFVEFIRHWSELLPAASEKLARHQAFTQGWLIGKDFLKFSDEKLYQFAREYTNDTMFLYGTADRARLITGPAGTLFGMFKNWQMHYIAQMIQYGGEAVMRGNFAPLLWMLGGTAAVGGVGALPFYGVADQMSKLFSDKSLMLNLYEMLGFSEEGEELADGMFYGLPAFLGVSLQGSAMAPGRDFAKDTANFFSIVHWDRMKYAGKTVGAAFDHWRTTGEHPINSPEVRDLFVRSVGPKTFYRAMQSWGDKSIRSLGTGYPIKDNAEFMERLFFNLNLTPVSIDKIYAAMDELWRDQQLRKQKVGTFGKAWRDAQDRGDSHELQVLMYQMTAQGIDMGSVFRSASSREQRAEEPVLERQFEESRSLPYRRALGVASQP